MIKNTIYTISRPPTDDFTYDIFVDIVAPYAQNNEAYYIWTNPPNTLINFFENTPFASPIVFIGIKDQIDNWQLPTEDFNWWKNRRQFIVEVISNMAKKHADKKFILFVSMEHLDHEFDEPNIHIIPWGGDWVNQQIGYSRLSPVLDKNFNSAKHFINLNRQARDHRIVAMSYLFGTGVAEWGTITYLNGLDQNRSTPFLDHIHWQFGPDHDEIKTKILVGFDLMRNALATPSDTFDIYHEYGNRPNDNLGNFKNRLRNIYRDSFVEIVSESSFSPPNFILSEKTAHAFYGCNFPIILSGCGIVAHLRELGLDVFDDIINHNYDLIKNPIDRIVSAIESNRRLLTEADYAKQSWRNCRSRFERNVQVMRGIYSWYENRTRQKFAETLELIG